LKLGDWKNTSKVEAKVCLISSIWISWSSIFSYSYYIEGYIYYY